MRRRLSAALLGAAGLSLGGAFVAHAQAAAPLKPTVSTGPSSCTIVAAGVGVCAPSGVSAGATYNGQPLVGASTGGAHVVCVGFSYQMPFCIEKNVLD